MNQKHTQFIIVMLSILALTPALAHKPYEGGNGLHDILKRHLDLSIEQDIEISAILAQGRAEAQQILQVHGLDPLKMRAMYQNIWSLRHEMMTGLAQVLDEEQLHSLQQELRQAFAQKIGPLALPGEQRDLMQQRLGVCRTQLLQKIWRIRSDEL